MNKKLTKLGIPYYSQKLDVKDPFWRRRGCGIVALKMAMDFLSSTWRPGRQVKYKKHSADFLIKEGLKNGAYLKGVGWIHDGLVNLAKAHGFKKSYRKEWNLTELKKNKKQQVLSYMIVLIKKGIPVLASMKRKKGGPASPSQGGHLVLLTGFEVGGEKLRGFYHHDPNSSSRARAAHKFIKTADFLKTWKGRIVVARR